MEASLGRKLDELRDQTCADRLALAGTFLLAGDRLLRLRPPEYRSAISRYYYAMFHCMRAAVYYDNDGDDHQKHEVLAQHTPADFPDSAVWQNRLKDARGIRNDADYDAYPKQHSEFRQSALNLRAQATAMIPLVHAYLVSKGCTQL